MLLDQVNGQVVEHSSLNEIYASIKKAGRPLTLTFRLLIKDHIHGHLNTPAILTEEHTWYGGDVPPGWKKKQKGGPLPAGWEKRTKEGSAAGGGSLPPGWKRQTRSVSDSSASESHVTYYEDSDGESHESLPSSFSPGSGSGGGEVTYYLDADGSACSELPSDFSPTSSPRDCYVDEDGDSHTSLPSSFSPTGKEEALHLKLVPNVPDLHHRKAEDQPNGAVLLNAPDKALRYPEAWTMGCQLEAINGETVVMVSFRDVMKKLKTAGRPLTLRFRTEVDPDTYENISKHAATANEEEIEAVWMRIAYEAEGVFDLMAGQGGNPHVLTKVPN